MMFDLKGIAYVREYFQVLQKYEHDDEEGIVNIEDRASEYSAPFKLFEATSNGDRRHSIKLDVEAEVGSSVVAKERFLAQKFGGLLNAKSSPAETSNYQEHRKILFTEVGGFDENRQKFPRNSFFYGVSRGQASHSCDALPALIADQNSQTQYLPPLNLQQRKIRRQCESHSSTEQFQLPTSPQVAPENRCCNHTSQERFAYLNRGSEYTSIPLSRRGDLVGRLTPLRESSGNPPTSHILEPALPSIGKYVTLSLNPIVAHAQILVVKKTRRSSKNGLTVARKPAEITSRLPTSNSSISLFPSAKSNLPRGRFSYPYFLGRYRTPSSPELRGSDRYTCLLQGQQILRSSSAGTLRHLPINPEAKLHIGTKNRNISFSSNRSRSHFHLSISYRLPKRDDMVVPTMAPNFVVGPFPSHEKDLYSAETVDSVRQSSSDATPGAAVRREINDTGRPPLNTSSMANAGSQEIDIAAADEVSETSDDIVAPPNSPNGEMTNSGECQDMLRRNYGHVSLPALFHSFLSSADPSIQHGMGRNNHSNAIDVEKLFYNLEDVSVCGSLAKGSGTKPSIGAADEHNAVFSSLKDSEFQGAAHPNRSRACTHGSLFGPMLPQLGESLVPARNDQGGDCTKSSVTVALPRSASSPTIPTRPQRSVSFAENCNSVTSARASERSKGSVSWADPDNQSPIICSHLRGPSFSADFEESMMTLPLPPAEHVVPVRSRRGSTASISPSIVLSEKPRGMWSQVKDFFTSCCSSF